MAKQKGPTLASVMQSILAELTQPISVDEFTQRMLERFPSHARDPLKRMHEYLRQDGPREGIIFLDAKTITSASIALKGVRFRVPLDLDEIKQGVVIAEPGFTPFIKSSSRYGWMAVNTEFFDENDQSIPSRVIALPHTMPGLVTPEPVTINHPAFELREWLRQQLARAGDSLLVTVLDVKKGQFRLEFEPSALRRQAEIDTQNKAFSDLVWLMLQETVDEQLITPFAIPTAFARLSSACEYPGDHWLQILTADRRMRVTDWMIVTADHRFPFDIILEQPGERAITEQSFTPEQGQRVYRFIAIANDYSQRHRIEILGNQTLADFDDVMRTAFHLDPMDHLSEFTRIIRRGKGKKPHKQKYGEINPFEVTAAMEVRVAGLGLVPGAELEYIYDFGDWIEHMLILERISEAERRGKYPRVGRVTK